MSHVVTPAAHFCVNIVVRWEWSYLCKWSTLKWPGLWSQGWQLLSVQQYTIYDTPNPSQFHTTHRTELRLCLYPSVSLTRHLNNWNCMSSEAINSFTGTRLFADVESMHYMYLGCIQSNYWLCLDKVIIVTQNGNLHYTLATLLLFLMQLFFEFKC